MNIDWGRKLSSRKFWGMIAGFITGLLVLFKVDANTVTQITGLIMSFGSIIIYILAEAYVDGKNVSGSTENVLLYPGSVEPILNEAEKCPTRAFK